MRPCFHGSCPPKPRRRRIAPGISRRAARPGCLWRIYRAGSQVQRGFVGQCEIVTQIDLDMTRLGEAFARRLPDSPGPATWIRPPRTCGMAQGPGQDLHMATLPASVNAGIAGLCHACGILASARPPPTPPPGNRCCRFGCQDGSCCGSPSGSSSDCCSRTRHAARGGYLSPNPLGHNTAEAAFVAATRASPWTQEV